MRYYDLSLYLNPHLPVEDTIRAFGAVFRDVVVHLCDTMVVSDDKHPWKEFFETKISDIDNITQYLLDAWHYYDTSVMDLMCHKEGPVFPRVSFLIAESNEYVRLGKFGFSIVLKNQQEDDSFLEKTFETCARHMQPIYGYVKISKRFGHTTQRHHGPDDGPSTLEWINIFGEEYRGVINDDAFATLPFTVKEWGGRKHYLLKVCERSEDYYRFQSKRRRKQMMKKIGRDCFGTDAYIPWYSCLFASLIVREAKKAKRIPSLE